MGSVWAIYLLRMFYNSYLAGEAINAYKTNEASQCEPAYSPESIFS
jgi:hypothetical protein